MILDFETARNRSIRVLLVEDDQAYRHLLTIQLMNLGCVVESVSSAAAFLTAVCSKPNEFNAAIVDLGLPDLDGDQIIGWLNDSELEAVRHLPVLVVTGNTEKAKSLDEQSERPIEVVRKPYEFTELKASFSGLLAG